MNVFAVRDLVNFVILFGLGLAVFYKNPRNKTNLFFMLYCFSVAYWDFVDFQFITARTYSEAVFWRYTFALFPLQGIFFTLFTLSFIEKLKWAKSKYIIIFVYIPVILYCLAQFFLSEELGAIRLSGNDWEYVWGEGVTPIWYQILLMIMYIGFFSFIGTLLVQFYRKSKDPVKKKQLRFMFWGAIIAVVLSFLEQIFYVLDISFSFVFFGLTVLSSFIAYAMIQFEFFSIDPLSAADTIVETMSDMLLLLDQEWNIIVVNKSVSHFLGYKDKELIGKSLDSLTSVSGRKSLSLKSCFRHNGNGEGVLLDYEIDFIRHDRKKIPVSLSCAKVEGSKGELRGIVCIARDITERKMHEQELKVYAERLILSKDKIRREMAKNAAVLFAIGEGISVIDTQGNILIVNKAFEEMLGWETKDVIDKPLEEIVRMEEEDGKKVRADNRLRVLPKYSSSSNSSDKEINFGLTDRVFYVTREGNRFPVTVTSTPIIFNKTVIGAVEVFRDITKETEVDRAKSEFVSLASHQLRTPLSTISWYAEVLLSGKLGKLKKEQQEYLDEVYKGNKRMIDLVSALLNVSRLELGTFTIEVVPSDLTEIADSVLKELEPQIKEKKLALAKVYDKNLPEDIKVDPNLMRIIFQNLLSNAVKYTPDKGNIDFTISVKDTKIGIMVKDTGYGIPKEQQDKIFTKLFRADNVRKTVTEGTGLGLYIVKSILETAGGKIWFESEENKGTTFFVTLPKKGMKSKRGSRELQ